MDGQTGTRRWLLRDEASELDPCAGPIPAELRCQGNGLIIAHPPSDRVNDGHEAKRDDNLRRAT
jgi:hypothetical protein